MSNKDKNRDLLNKIREARQCGKKVVIEEDTLETEDSIDQFFSKNSIDDDLKDWIVDDDMEFGEYHNNTTENVMKKLVDGSKRSYKDIEPNHNNVKKLKHNTIEDLIEMKHDNKKDDYSLENDALLNTILENMSSNEAFADAQLSLGSLEVNSQLLMHPQHNTNTPDFKDLINSDGKVYFYWFDAIESMASLLNQQQECGYTNVYLFGKVYIPSSKKLHNCSVTVENIPRQIYIHPVDEVIEGNNWDAILEEFGVLAKKYGIKTFEHEIVSRNFAYSTTNMNATNFHRSDYLKITYSSKFPTLPNPSSNDIRGVLFDYIYGTTNTCLEHFILSTKLKGPQWLSITNCKINPILETWCDLQLKIDNMSDITVVNESTILGGLPSTILYNKMFLSLHTQNINDSVSNSNRKVESDENKCIAIICVRVVTTNGDIQNLVGVNLELYQKNQIVSNTTTISNNINLHMSNNESQLLSWFLNVITEVDPDFIIGYKTYDTTLKYLLVRLKMFNRHNYTKIGRFQKMPSIKRIQMASIDKLPWGRCLIDLNAMFKELIPGLSNLSIYDISRKLLSNTKYDMIVKNRISYDHDDDDSQSNKNNIDVNIVISNLKVDVELYDYLSESLQLLPLFLQLTSICGFIISKCFNCGRSERNEYLLLHAFVENNAIFPDKIVKNNKFYNKNPNANDNKPKYEGGLVLEPKKGYYRNFILLMDFNSLYPSIIQEYNICFSTIPIDNINVTDHLHTTNRTSCQLTTTTYGESLGILPKEIKKLVDRRRDIKKLIHFEKNVLNLQQLDIRQKALKLTANSMYGCLGFVGSRFQASHIAALITAHGRYILRKTNELVENLGYEIIYGDTDSLMINTHCTDINVVKDIGREIKNKVNKSYQYLEFEMDGMYKPFLLLRKKKYAAVNITLDENNEISSKIEVKGLDMIRHDWSHLAKTCGNDILGMILNNVSYDDLLTKILSHLSTLKDNIYNGNIPINQYEIDKCLIKHPSMYANDKALPHVIVAKRLISKGVTINVGDTIRYIICIDGSSNSAMQRAYHITEMKNSTINVDYKYYIKNQIYSVISRLCECIEGLSSQDIAHALGIDDYKATVTTSNITDTNNILVDIPGKQINSLEQLLFGRLCCDSAKVKPIKVVCSNESCTYYHQDVDFVGIIRETKDGDHTILSSGFRCDQCKNHYNISNICNYVDQLIHHCITMYYSGFLSCNNPGCNYTTRDAFVSAYYKNPKCPLCRFGELDEEFTEKQLYFQLIELKKLFDLEYYKVTYKSWGVRLENYVGGYLDLIKRIYSRVVLFLDQNSFSVINLEELFCFI